MPVHAEQQRQASAIPNPFDEPPPRIAEYTAQEIATLQSRLDKQLGPEYISTRPGAGGAKLHYVTAEKVINIANEVFGFNGWSSSIQNVHVDFVSEKDGRISMSCSIVCRVTLRDGTHHEDIGCGSIENCRSKAQAFEKAKKEAATDALKRALRNFGNVLGNCLYDKEYVARVTKLKALPTKWDVDNLHRHPDYSYVKKEPKEDDTVAIHQAAAARRSHQAINPGQTLHEGEDEFGGDPFDGMDLAHPDGVILDETSLTDIAVNTSAVKSGTAMTTGENRPNTTRVQSMPSIRDGRSPILTNNRVPGQTGTSSHTEQQPQQITPLPHQMAPPINAGHLHRPPMNGPTPQANNSNSVTAQQRRTHHSTPDPPGQPSRPNGGEPVQGPLADQNMPSIGFVPGRNAELLQNIESPNGPILGARHIPAFNPHSESPSIRRTLGVEHAASKAISREDIARIRAQGQQGITSAKTSEPIGAENVQPVAAQPKAVKTNFINPQEDAHRRIGMPGGGAMQSPLTNRGAYKPPAIAPGGLPKRGPDGLVRTPLSDVSNVKLDGDQGAGDVKRPRVEGRA